MLSKREVFGQKFYYLVLALWAGSGVIFNSTLEYVLWWKFDDANRTIDILILVLLVIHILMFQKYDIRSGLFILLGTILVSVATINSNHNTLMATWIFIVASKHLDFDKAIRVVYYCQLIFFLLIIYMFYAGYISEVITYRGSIVRHSLGFSHPNQLGVEVFLLVINRTYIRKNKQNIFDALVAFGAAYFVYKVANSKTSYYVLTLLGIVLLVNYVMRKIGFDYTKNTKRYILIAALVNIVSVLMSITNIKKYHVLEVINSFMSNRFSECYRTYRYYGTSLLGQDIQLFVSRHIIGRVFHFWLDNAYVALLLRYGIIIYFLFSVLYIATMIEYGKLGNIIVVEILSLYAIYGVMENNFFSVSQNFFLILMAYPIYYSVRNKKNLAIAGSDN